MKDDFPRTRARIEREIEDGIATRGIQLAVEVAGQRVLDVALGASGTGTAMEPRHLFRVYCTIKPVTAIALARLVDRGLIDLDEPLAPHLPAVHALEGTVTLTHVLNHTAGLHTIDGVSMELVTPERRRAIVERRARPPGWRVGVDAAYGEYSSWHVLGWLVEQLTGDPLREHLRAAVLDPLGLDDTFIGMSPATYREVRERIGVNLDLRHGGGFPLLVERSPRVCAETNPAHGGYTTARDLARWYSCLLARLDATMVDAATDHAGARSTDRAGSGAGPLPAPGTVAGWTAPARPRVYDHVLGRECSFGLGLMTGLADHEFGDHWGPGAFGHSGYVGSSFAFADPDRAVAVGVVCNGIVSHDAAFLRRRALLRALAHDLDDRTPCSDTSPDTGADASADDAGVGAAPAGTRRRRRWSTRWRR